MVKLSDFQYVVKYTIVISYSCIEALLSEYCKAVQKKDNPIQKW
jgi:hypothetical protein